MVSGSPTGATTLYEYDHRNRLTKVTDKTLYSGGSTTRVVEYTYDAFDRLVKRAADTTSPFDMGDAAVEQMVYDGQNVVLKFNGTSSLTINRYLHGQAVDQVLAEEQTQFFGTSNRVYWTLTDNLGTIRDVVNQNGVLKDHIVFDSFRKVTSETSTSINLPFGFTGFWYDRDTKLHFSGYLDYRDDRAGNRTDYSYDGSNKLTQITDISGRNTTFTYDGAGYLDNIEDYAGRRTQITVALVDGVRKLTNITDPDPDGPSNPLTSTVTSFTYNSTTHLVTQMTDGESGLTDFAYSAFRLTSVTHPDDKVEAIYPFQTRALATGTSPTNLAETYLGHVRQARIRDQNNGETVIEMDRFGHAVESIDPLGNVTLYARNSEGLVLRETSPDPDGAGPLGHWINAYSYDSKGNLTGQTLPGGNMTENGVQRVVPGGRSRKWTYNTTFGVPTSYIDELGRKTIYDVDPANGNVRYVQQVVGAEDTGLTYNTTTGVVTGATDDQITSYLWTTTAGDDGSLGNSDDTVAGLVRKAYDPLGQLTQYLYYTVGDQATHPNTNGLLKQITLPAVGGVTATRLFDYDNKGNLDTYTDEENRTTTWEYDELDRLTKETLPDPDTGDGIAAPYRAYTYDKLNRKTLARDEEGNTTSFSYTYLAGGGLKITITEPARCLSDSCIAPGTPYTTINPP